jgi:hypothetical protein
VVLILREWGEQWNDPYEPSHGDGLSDALADGPLGRLCLQVTRVPHNSSFWRSLHSDNGVACMTGSAADFSDALLAAILAKKQRYSAADRANMVLVLDGEALLALDSPAVRRDFTVRHLRTAEQAGFADVFLVTALRLTNLLRPFSV